MPNSPPFILKKVLPKSPPKFPQLNMKTWTYMEEEIKKKKPERLLDSTFEAFTVTR